MCVYALVFVFLYVFLTTVRIYVQIRERLARHGLWVLFSTNNNMNNMNNNNCVYHVSVSYINMLVLYQ